MASPDAIRHYQPFLKATINNRPYTENLYNFLLRPHINIPQLKQIQPAYRPNDFIIHQGDEGFSTMSPDGEIKRMPNPGGSADFWDHGSFIFSPARAEGEEFHGDDIENSSSIVRAIMNNSRLRTPHSRIDDQFEAVGSKFGYMPARNFYDIHAPIDGVLKRFHGMQWLGDLDGEDMLLGNVVRQLPSGIVFSTIEDFNERGVGAAAVLNGKQIVSHPSELLANSYDINIHHLDDISWDVVERKMMDAGFDIDSPKQRHKYLKDHGWPDSDEVTLRNPALGIYIPTHADDGTAIDRGAHWRGMLNWQRQVDDAIDEILGTGKWAN